MGLKIQPFLSPSIEVLNYFNINFFKNLLRNGTIIDFFCFSIKLPSVKSIECKQLHFAPLDCLKKIQ